MVKREGKAIEKMRKKDIENLKRRPPVVWRFGNKIPAETDYQVNHPAYAEEIDQGTNILIADVRNDRVLVVNKATKEVVDKYTVNRPQYATLHTDGDLLVPSWADDTVYKIGRNTHNVNWEYSIPEPRCVIPWSSTVLAISRSDASASSGIYWVKLSDKSTVKSYTPGWNYDPNGITKLSAPQAIENTDEETVLMGTENNNVVREIKYSDLSVVWEYSVLEQTAPYAVRIGGISGAPKKMSVTLISDNEGGRIVGITAQKDRIFQIGGRIGRNNVKPHNVNLICPQGLSITRNGNLLVADSHGHQVLEIDLSRPPQPRYPEAKQEYFKFGGDFANDLSIDAGDTSDPVELTYYGKKTIYFYSDTAGTLTIQVIAPDGTVYTYDTVSISADELESYPMSGGIRELQLKFDTAATISAWYHAKR